MTWNRRTLHVLIQHVQSVTRQFKTDSLIDYGEEHGRPTVLIPDRDPFRLGPLEGVWSKQGLLLCAGGTSYSD